MAFMWPEEAEPAPLARLNEHTAFVVLMTCPEWNISERDGRLWRTEGSSGAIHPDTFIGDQLDAAKVVHLATEKHAAAGYVYFSVPVARLAPRKRTQVLNELTRRQQSPSPQGG